MSRIMWAGNDEAGDTEQPRQYGMSDVAADSQEGCAGDDKREPLTMGEAICLAGIWTLSGVAVVSVVAYFVKVFA